MHQTIANNWMNNAVEIDGGLLGPLLNINCEPKPRTKTPNYGEHLASTMKTSFPNIAIVMDDCMTEEIWYV